MSETHPKLGLGVLAGLPTLPIASANAVLISDVSKFTKEKGKLPFLSVWEVLD